MKTYPSRIEMLNEFYNSPDEALFRQETIAAVLDCSTALLERNRCKGSSVPFIKLERTVLYKKQDVIDYLNKRKLMSSASKN